MKDFGKITIAEHIEMRMRVRLWCVLALVVGLLS